MARFVIALFDTFLRLGALALMWGALALMSALTVRFFPMFLLIFFAGVPSAFLSSHYILRRPFLTEPDRENAPKTASAAPSAKSSAPKAKREDDLTGMFHLLDEDDRYDIQQRIKQRLIEHIDEGDAADFDSFAELLNDRPRQKRS